MIIGEKNYLGTSGDNYNTEPKVNTKEPNNYKRVYNIRTINNENDDELKNNQKNNKVSFIQSNNNKDDAKSKRE